MESTNIVEKEQRISFATAKLAKEKKFSWMHADFYIDKRENGDYTDLPCVPQSLLQRWLRDNYSIEMSIRPFYETLPVRKRTYVCDAIEIERTGHVIKSHRCDTYEEALEEGLQNGLKLIEVKETGDILAAHKDEI